MIPSSTFSGTKPSKFFPNRYLNQSWFNIDEAPKNIIQCKFLKYTDPFIHEYQYSTTLSSCHDVLRICICADSHTINDDQVILWQGDPFTYWPRRYHCNPKLVIFKLIPKIDNLSISYEISLMWMPQNFIDDEPTLVHVIAWCCQK